MNWWRITRRSVFCVKNAVVKTIAKLELIYAIAKDDEIFVFLFCFGTE